MEPSIRRPWLAAVLNVFLIGCGHLYVGQAHRFFIFLVAVVGGSLVLGWLGLLSSFLGFTAAIILFAALLIFAIVDAFLLARRANPYTPKWYNRWYVYALWIAALAFASVAWPASRAQLLGYASYRVPGFAMAPSIANGDYIIVDTWAYRTAHPSPGEVVVVRVPETGVEYVRRIARQVSAQEVEFKTDNADFASSGPGLRALPISAIVGRVTSVFFSPDLSRIGKRVE